MLSAAITTPAFEVRSSDKLKGLVDVVQEFQPDLIILDLRMPDGEPLNVARDLLQSDPNLKLMILSMHTEKQYVKRAMQIGARAYVSKRSSATDLLSAIHTVLEGGRYMSPQMDMVSTYG